MWPRSQGQGRCPLRVLEGLCSRERRRAGVVKGLCRDAEQSRFQEDEELRGKIPGNRAALRDDAEFQGRLMIQWKGWEDRDDGPSSPSIPHYAETQYVVS